MQGYDNGLGAIWGNEAAAFNRLLLANCCVALSYAGKPLVYCGTVAVMPARSAGRPTHEKRTAVGDRYVLEELRRGGYALGGEQSGHIVVPAAGTTGDGILTGLLLMEQLASTRQSLACLASIMTVLPQELINVRVADKHAVAQAETVRDAVTAAEAELAGQGRVLLRPSGTEQLVRVMVEAPTADAAHGIAARIADVVAGAGA